jgi:hypothetical protein
VPGSRRRRLELTEQSRLSRGEAHVAREHKLAADASHATLDLSDRDEAACAQVMEQEADRLFIQLAYSSRSSLTRVKSTSSRNS